MQSRCTHPAQAILIIGKKPPPVGGVTVHVARLLDGLTANGFPFVFSDMQHDTLLLIAKNLCRHKVFHLHTSNSWLQLFSTLLCRIFRKTLIISYHGNLGRYGTVRNQATRLSVRLCAYPIVQNFESQQLALQLNIRTRCIRAYIPGDPPAALTADIESEVIAFVARYRRVYCTHACDVVFDKNGRELYGICDLVQHIRNFQNIGLIIVNPSGRYRQFIKLRVGHIPINVLLTNHLPDFRSVLSHCYGYVRNTTTDGASVTIEEALDMGKTVLASDAVSRVPGCEVFHHIQDVDLAADFSQHVKSKNLEKIDSDEVLCALMELYRNVLGEHFFASPYKKTKA